MTPYHFTRNAAPPPSSNALPLRSTSSSCAGYTANRRRPRSARRATPTDWTSKLPRTPSPPAGLTPGSAVPSPANPRGTGTIRTRPSAPHPHAFHGPSRRLTSRISARSTAPETQTRPHAPRLWLLLPPSRAYVPLVVPRPLPYLSNSSRNRRIAPRSLSVSSAFHSCPIPSLTPLETRWHCNPVEPIC